MNQRPHLGGAFDAFLAAVNRVAIGTFRLSPDWCALKDIYYAEKQIYKSLPKMAKAAQSDQLRAAFEKHYEETEGQIERLEQIFQMLGKPARGKKCDAIEGLLDEGEEIMDEYQGTPALDAGLLAAAQRSSIMRFHVMVRLISGPAPR